MSHNIYAIRQVVTAGNQFDGTVPDAGSPTNIHGVLTYPDDNNGGRFDFPESVNPYLIYSFQAYMGGAPMTLWALNLIDSVGTVPLVTGTNENYIFWTPNNPAVVIPGQHVTFTTTGSNKKMYAIMIYSRAQLGE